MASFIIYKSIIINDRPNTSNTVYPEYFKVQNIQGFSTEKGVLNFQV